MAKFPYDVNTTRRIIDVYKQFQGGLKTVDTDDALGSVFLRQAENVSLSEFGFLEKRYGTIEKDLIKETNGKLQGYWEYLGFAIFVIDGVFYYKGTGDAVQIQRLYQESADVYAPNTIFGKEWRYPTVFGNAVDYTQVTGCEFTVTSTTYSQTDQTTPINQRDICGEGEDASTKSNYTICTVSNLNDPLPEGLTHPFYTCQVYSASDTTSTAKVYTPSFPTNTDMNAVNVNNVLYIFTGKYPVYVKIVENVPRFYVFPITIPTYDEIVVTGHNLLEEDYDEIYYQTESDIQYTNPGVSTNTYAQLTNNVTNPGFFAVQKETSASPEEKKHAPQIPFQTNGQLHFNFKYAFNPTYLEEYDAGNQDRIYILDVDNVSYRSSGVGASEYVDSDRASVEFTPANNYTDSAELVAGVEGAIIKTQITTDYTEDPGNPGNTDFHFYNNITQVSTDTTYSDIDFSINIDSQRYQRINDLNLDLVPKDDFKVGDVYEFRLLKLSNPSTGATESLFIPRTGSDIEDFYYSSFAEVTPGTSQTNWETSNEYGFNFNTDQPKITIVPVDSNGTELSSRTQTLTVGYSNLTRTTTGYRFTVPSLISGSNVENYKVTFTGAFNATRRVLTSGTTKEPDPTIVYKELVKIESLSDQRNLTTATNIGLTLNNLLAGTYDFRLRYKLSKYTLDSEGVLNLVDGDDGVEFTDVFFYDIPITAEKLQDIPGQTDDFLPKLKPIWSCNKVMEHYGKLMVWGSTEMPTAIFYSFPDRPTYFPSKFYLDFTNDTNQKIEAVTPYMNILVAQTASQTWGIRGNSGLIDAPAPYVPFGINSTVGTIAYKSVRPVRNHLFFLSRQGVIALKSLYAADEQYNIDFVDRNIRNIVPQDSDAVGIQFDNQYWLNFPNNSITLRWYIDKKAWVKDVYQGYTTDGFNGVFKYQIANGKLEFITHPSVKDEENANKTIYKVGADYDIPTDIFAPIKAKFETAFLNQNYPFHPKNYKEAKLDFTVQNEYNKGREDFYDSAQDTNFGTPENDEVTITVPQPFQKNHTYRIAFTMASTSSVTHIPLTSISIEGQTNYVTGLTAVGTKTCSTNPDLNTTEAACTAAGGTFAVQNTLTWDFSITNDYQENATTVDFSGEFGSNVAQDIASIIITDITYDDTLTFSTYVLSEDITLNFDNYSGYNQATADVDLDLKLKGQLGDWTFGESDFGKKVTAVKTIKLSGKGYNAKLYLEDLSKSKWTLESLGLTYKMKRARSK